MAVAAIKAVKACFMISVSQDIKSYPL